MRALILSYPFSQTTWLNSLLNAMGGNSLHDKSVDFSSLGEFNKFCDEYDGVVVDTALINIHDQLPHVKMVLIENNIKNIRNSLSKRNLPEGLCDYQIPYMESLLKRDYVYKIQRKDLLNKDSIRELCEYIDSPFDAEVFADYRNKWIRTDISEILKRMRESGKDHSWLINKEGVIWH